eukprot:1158832-Pelagomonas_calceolata.AAC.2
MRQRGTGGLLAPGLAVELFIFNSTPSGNKLVGILNRVGLKLVGKLNGTLLVQTQLFQLVRSMLSITCPTNAQEIGMKSHSFALISLQRSACCRCAASNCCPGLVGLSHAVSCAGPLFGPVPAA